MSKFIRITVFNAGGEYTFGVIEDEAERQAMLDAIENDEVRSSIYYEDSEGDEVSLECFEFVDVLQVYGPEMEGAKLIVSVCEDDSFTEEVETIVDTQISETKCIEFTSSNPYLTSEKKEEFNDESLLWGTYKIEKRIYFPAELTLSDDENFEITNVFVGSMNMDETICNAEIADTIYYIRADEQLKLVKDHYGEDYADGDTLGDIIVEIQDENIGLLEPFLLDIGDIEGKGEYENDYNVVSNFDGEVLYEGGEY
ncbi:MAG: hypothetical protein DRH57_07960 [Candidatus Cloacimonadota bacterium]|nr:MAG: hypothetical protein DRH57_07960 [Candidatus Cloacimonadota bacterium]